MRQFSDEQLKVLIERGAVIGGALDAWMMVPDWIRGTTTPQSSGVLLKHFVDHIDHEASATRRTASILASWNLLDGLF